MTQYETTGESQPGAASVRKCLNPDPQPDFGEDSPHYVRVLGTEPLVCGAFDAEFFTISTD